MCDSVREIDEEEEKGMERTNHSGNKIPKYRKCVLAMNPITIQIAFVQTFFTQRSFRQRKVRKMVQRLLSQIHRNTRARLETRRRARRFCVRREGYDFKQACVAVVKLAFGVKKSTTKKHLRSWMCMRR